LQFTRFDITAAGNTSTDLSFRLQFEIAVGLWQCTSDSTIVLVCGQLAR